MSPPSTVLKCQNAYRYVGMGVGWFVALQLFAKPTSCKALPCITGCGVHDWVTFSVSASKSMFCEIMALQYLLSGLAFRVLTSLQDVNQLRRARAEEAAELAVVANRRNLAIAFACASLLLIVGWSLSPSRLLTSAGKLDTSNCP